MSVSTVSLTLVDEGSALPSGAVAELRDDRVVIERLSTPRRYYLLPVVLGAVGLSYGAVAAWAGVAGFVVGVASGFAVASYLGSRRRDVVLHRIRTGDRTLSPDFVLKHNKVKRLERDGDDGGGSVTVVTSDGELELRGGKENLDAVYEALV